MQQAKRKIKANDIVQDVRSGLTDLEIMARHELSPKELERVLGQLVRLNLLSDRELQERSSPSVQSEPYETTCPSCGRRYPKEAHECPECGFSADDVPSPTPVRRLQDPLERESRSSRTAIFVVSILVFVVIIGSLFTYFLLKRQKEAKLASLNRAAHHFLTLQEKAEAYASQNELSGVVALSPVEEIRKALSVPDLDVDAPDIDDRTLLMVASEYGRFDVAKLLLYYGANVYATDRKGDTPGLLAAKNGFTDVLDLFVSKGYDIDFRNRSGESVRSIAHASGDPKLNEVVVKGTKLPKTDRIAIYKMWKERRLDSLRVTCVRLCDQKIKRRPCVDDCMRYYDLGEVDSRILE